MDASQFGVRCRGVHSRWVAIACKPIVCVVSWLHPLAAEAATSWDRMGRVTTGVALTCQPTGRWPQGWEGWRCVARPGMGTARLVRPVKARQVRDAVVHPAPRSSRVVSGCLFHGELATSSSKISAPDTLTATEPSAPRLVLEPESRRSRRAGEPLEWTGLQGGGLQLVLAGRPVGRSVHRGGGGGRVKAKAVLDGGVEARRVRDCTTWYVS